MKSQNGKQRRAWASSVGLTLIGLCSTLPAHAHISLERAGTHLSRDGDNNLKDGPCGKAGSTRGSHVYTYAPGQKITIKVTEFVPHPSYFRIAFDDAGDDGFEEPASIDPIDDNRGCPISPDDHCGASDFYNNETVLPGMDNLDPHKVEAADYLVAPTYTWEVTLPDIECDDCTLQLIQVMEDDGPHGPYDPTPGAGVADIYHQCIDLVLKKGAPPGGGGGDPAGGDPNGGGTVAGGDAGTGGSAGGATGGTTPGADSDAGGAVGPGASSPDASSTSASAGCDVGRSDSRVTWLFSLLALGLYVQRRRAAVFARGLCASR